MHKRTAKLALVTGASSGIGYEIARLFAEDGHDLILVSRSQAELDRIAGEFNQDWGVEATAIAADLAESGAAQALYEDVVSRGRPLDYLVNDAGQGNYGKFWETDLDKDLLDIQLNVHATVVLTKLFLRDMLARKQGRILQLASMVSKNAAPYMAVYAGTKAFIYNFSQSVANELKGTGVTMTALRPGATDTDFFSKAHAQQMTVVQDGKLADAAQPARDGYEAMMKGEDAVVSGVQNKLMDAAAKLMPDDVVAKQMRKLHEPKKDAPRH